MFTEEQRGIWLQNSEEKRAENKRQSQEPLMQEPVNLKEFAFYSVWNGKPLGVLPEFIF